MHVGVGDGHGGAVCVSLEVSILEGVGACDDGVEAVARGVDKEEVVDHGYLFAHAVVLAH